MVTLKEDDIMKENLNMNSEISNYYEELKINYSWLTMENDALKCSKCSIDFKLNLDDKEFIFKEIESHNNLHPDKLAHDSDEEFDFQEFSLTPYWQSLIKNFKWVIYKDCKFRCRICEEGYEKSKVVSSTTWSCPEKLPKIMKSNAVMYSKWQRFASHEETDNHQKAIYVVNNFTELDKPIDKEAGPNSPKPNVKTRRSKVLSQVPLIDKSSELNETSTINLNEATTVKSSSNKQIKEIKTRSQKRMSMSPSKSKINKIKIEEKIDISANKLLLEQMNIVVQINEAEKLAGDAALLIESDMRNEITENSIEANDVKKEIDTEECLNVLTKDEEPNENGKNFDKSIDNESKDIDKHLDKVSDDNYFKEKEILDEINKSKVLDTILYEDDIIEDKDKSDNPEKTCEFSDKSENLETNELSEKLKERENEDKFLDKSRKQDDKSSDLETKDESQDKLDENSEHSDELVKKDESYLDNVIENDKVKEICESSDLKTDEPMNIDENQNQNLDEPKENKECLDETVQKSVESDNDGQKSKVQLSNELFPLKSDKKNQNGPIARKTNLSRKSKSIFLENLQNEKPKRRSLDKKSQISSKVQSSQPSVSLETNNSIEEASTKSVVKSRKSQVKRKKSNENENYDFDAFKKMKLTSPKKGKSPTKSTSKPQVSRINDPKQIINDKIEIMEKLQLTGVSKRKSNNKRLISSIDRTIKPNFVSESNWIQLVNEFVWLYSSDNRINCFICEEAYKKFPLQLKKTQFTSPTCVLDFKTCQDNNSIKYGRLAKHQSSLNHQTAYNLLNNIASTNSENSRNYNVNSITLTAPAEINLDIPECLLKHEMISLKERYSWLIINKTNYGCQICMDSYKTEPNDMIKSRFTDGFLEFEETETNSNFKSRIIKHSENYRHVLATNLMNSLSILDSDKKHTRLRDGTAMKIDYRKLSLDGRPSSSNNVPEEEVVKPKTPAKISPKKSSNTNASALESKHQIKCPQCQSNFSQITDLTFHIELCDQANTELLACPCNPRQYQYNLISKLDLHATQEHSNEAMFHCYICSQQFQLISHLFIHICDVHMVDWNPCNTYGPENLVKIFGCIFCQCTFSTNVALTDHYVSSSCHNHLKVSVMLEKCEVEKPPQDSISDNADIEIKSLIDDNESVQLELIDDIDMVPAPKSKKIARKSKTTPKLPQVAVVEAPKPILHKTIAKRNVETHKRGRKIGQNITKKFKAGSGELKTPTSTQPSTTFDLKKKFQVKQQQIPPQPLEKFKFKPKTETIKKAPKEYPVKEKLKPKVEEIKLITTIDNKNEPPPKRAKKFAIIFHSTGSPKKSNLTANSHSSPSKIMIQTPNAHILDETFDKNLNRASIDANTSSTLASVSEQQASINDGKLEIDSPTGINQSLSFMDRMKQIRQLKKQRAEKLREETLTKITASPNIDDDSSNAAPGSNKDRCVCIMCGEYFRSFTSRDQHIKAYHRQFKLFNCHLCTMNFRTHVSLRKHAQRYHADQITYAVFGANDGQVTNDAGASNGEKSSKPDTNIVVAKESKVAANNMVKCEICSMVFMNKAGYNLHYTAQHKKTDVNNESSVTANSASNNTSANLNTSDNLNTSALSNNVAGTGTISTTISTSKQRKGPEDIVKRLALTNWETDLQSCMVCQETLDNDLEFLIHTLDHEKEIGKALDAHNNNQFACPSCCRLFFGKDGKLYLKDHYNMIHLKRPKPTCETCQAQFNSTYCYHQHLRLFKGNCTVGSGNTISDPYSVLHAEERHAYICNRCQTLFAGQAAKSRFEKHLETCKSNIDDDLDDDLKIDDIENPDSNK